MLLLYLPLYSTITVWCFHGNMSCCCYSYLYILPLLCDVSMVIDNVVLLWLLTLRAITVDVCIRQCSCCCYFYLDCWPMFIRVAFSNTHEVRSLSSTPHGVRLENPFCFQKRCCIIYSFMSYIFKNCWQIKWMIAFA